MVNYNLGKIYKIVCNDTGLIYIGSTCEPTLARRLSGHVGRYKIWCNDSSKISYIRSFKILENANYNIVLIEEYPCETKDQLLARERFYIESLQCVNKQIPTRTMKEYDKKYRETHKERIEVYQKVYNEKYRGMHKERLLEKNKQYRDQHKEKIERYNKAYYQENKQKLQCHICNINIVLRNRKIHEKTKTHQNNLIKFNTENNLFIPINDDFQA